MCSSKATVTNGVEQGGILSPALFNVYMDDLSLALNESIVGGTLGGTLISHLCYADGLCLISLSSASMQILLKICNMYARNHRNVLNLSIQCFPSICLKFQLLIYINM